MKKPILIIILTLVISSLALRIRVPDVKAIIWIEGHITSDTTWTPIDTYRAVNDTYVDPGVTLTIEPDVCIEIGDNFSLIVQGSLNATGIPDHPILFTSIPRPSPSPGIWNTVQFAGNESEFFTLKHTTVEYGTSGVTVQSKGKTILEKNCIYNCSNSGIRILCEGTLSSTLTIRENTLKHNYKGISSATPTIYTAVPQSDILIENNSICHNENYGISLTRYTYGEGRIENVVVSSNTITKNGGGVSMHSQSSYGTANHLNDITVTSNIITNNGGNGIRLLSSSGPRTGRLYDVNVSSNTITNNGGNGIYLRSSGYGASVHDVNVFNNTVSTNKRKGIYVYAMRTSYGTANLYDVNILDNTASFNDEDGILLQSSTGPLFNVTVYNNTVLTNSEIGIHAVGQSYGSQAFDLYIDRNVMAANKYGSRIAGGIRTYFIANSISHNTYGVFYVGTNYNWAENNDIYRNIYGMNVTDGSTVKAEYNYWGRSTGPYHKLNPEGTGNPVNGDGTDLDYIPFLTPRLA